MVNDAEANKEADKKARDVVDSRNNLDSLVLGCEKMIKDSEGKISDEDKKKLEDAIADAKTKLTSENVDELKAAHETLQNASHAIASQMYQQEGAPGQEGAGPDMGAGAEAGANAGNQKKDDGDDVVDADFKEV